MQASTTDHPSHLIDQILQASAERQPLRTVGGNTKSFLGTPTTGTELATTDWSGIVSYEPTELVITAKAGTPLAEVEALLAGQGQCFPFEPPRFGPGGTVGGMVASGLAGPARATAGSVRDFVLGARFINGRGELLTFGGQVMKNVAGYDVSRVMAGSMGTLGVISEVSLKVLPVALSEATLVFSLGQHDALEQLHRWGGQPLPINASCWVKDDTQADAPDLLFVRLRGAVAAVEAACERMAREAGGTRMDNAQAGPDWDACRDQRLPFFTAPSPGLCLWRLSVPQTAPVLALPYPQFIEWQGAQRWLWAPASAADALRAAASAVNGHATLFRAGADGAPGVPRFQNQSAALQSIQARLLESFDPAGIFNPHRMG
ncbi:MAG: glycolate oxidase subunit GlcE [Hydrogenophaga sp.]|jgi:glycolate oxidase FAD binding subunit|uniref:glycolate oxidase subunit GlcE n=1 Tax=Hydrogenophaga sp. TaxID=1904254 RepID=UPI002721C35F|nr:glycolate oxidase subunit GlcE [Hydrogenophaga sp.]MDO8889298.1 glycolate oxidase subunit GlcE [Hydrogenophaga sp.]MDP1783675.1 glycolate oxidase subunit GlcE [Hydrogenophaga sp.]MDP2264815.1 glycolate oxidase subunit GlcE [Hydrogenophaga sp.]MDP3203503.1 glycolate oxidase subunit GlcE [Hydrogenophaga sp.]MDZ4128136.1 glycolate oxidase subunit GlcE [Hydrogenophaga sp.]